MTEYSIDKKRIANAVSEILAAIGEDANRPGLQNTPNRVAEAYQEFFWGVGAEPDACLLETIDAGEQRGEIITLSGIHFRSVCEHHLLPFYGEIKFAYQPKNKIVGFGSIIKVIETLSARPQIQERLNNQIVASVQKMLQPEGVAVEISAQHDCVRARGPKQQYAKIVTSVFEGSFKNETMKHDLQTRFR